MNYLFNFKKSVLNNKDKVAIVDENGNRKTTYKELDELSDKVSHKINSLNIDKGNFILINMPRSMEYIACYLGIMKAGCVVVPTSLEYPKDRIDYIYDNCNAKLIINKSFLNDINNYDEYENYSDDLDIAVLLYTSGSTGNPKGISYTNYDLNEGQERVKEIIDIDIVNFAFSGQMSFASHVFEVWTTLNVGGTVFVVPDGTIKSVKLLEDFYVKNNITMGWIIPQMLKIFNNKAKSLKIVLSGGERLTNIGKRDYKIYCSYGMSEVGGILTHFLVDKEYDNTPIGKPYSDAKVIIVDEKDNELPNGIEGEICFIYELHTEYFKDKDKTNATMKKLDNGKVLYHTGDIGYINTNNDLVFVNRKDWMIKINGQRVESLEVENVMRNINGISDAIVKAFTDSGKTYLVGYYTTNTDIDKSVIKKNLAKKLPDYMIPSFLVKLDEVPKNVNGKVDRKQLLPPNINEFKAKYKAPNTNEEKILVDAFEQVLMCGKIGVNDNFFNLGGDSIKVMKLINIINIDGLSSNHIYNGKTVKGILSLLKKSKDNKLIHTDKYLKSYPLTQSQEGVYLDSITNPETLKYNIPVLLNIPSSVNNDTLINAINKVCNNHDSINICIKTINGLPQMVRINNNINIITKNVIDLDLEIKEFIKPFDLENGPLYRFEIVNDKYLLLDFHHLVFDGTSLEVFIKELVEVLNNNELVNEELNLFDIALNENSDLFNDKVELANKFYDNEFSNLEADSHIISDVISDDLITNNTVITKELVNVKVGDTLSFINNNGLTESTFFISAFAYALGKFNGTTNSIFTTVHNGRTDNRLNNSIGMFVRTLPLYCEFDEKELVIEFLKKFNKKYYDTLSNDYVPFSKLASLYGLNNDTSFVYQSELFNGVAYDGELISPTFLDTYEAVGDFNLMLLKTDNGFVINLHYNPNLYTKELIGSFIDLYEMILIGFTTKKVLKDINLSSINNTNLINKFNETEYEYDTNKLILDRFYDVVNSKPNNICLVSDGEKFTYQEINELSNKIAYHLINKGIGKGDVIGILVGRNKYFLPSALGSLKAGCAYMPLDPSYPIDRLNYMMQDSLAKVLIYDLDYKDYIDSNNSCIRISTDSLFNLNESKVILPVIKPRDLFVLLYTSGSTGKPKGVMYEHSNALVTSIWVQKYYEMNEFTHLANYASFGFDAHVFDIYPAIISGSELHIIKEDLRLDFINLVKYFNDNEITQVVMTTQVARQFVNMKELKTLKHLSAAGEKLPAIDPPSFNFYNLYGPTEGSVITSFQRVEKKYKDIPIGYPVDNLKAYIVDQYDRLLPVGAVGELWISGNHVTRGYLNNLEKTTLAYSSNPFSNDFEYDRVYKTGDIIRYLPTGNLQFIGRRDNQVKIRGYRIELTEVEEVIARYPNIKDVTVACFDNTDGSKYIVAYIVSSEKIDTDNVKKFIASEKPPYMVPSIIMQIDKIPLNQNHKVNKKALPVPEKQVEVIVKPETELQKEIFEVVSNIIGDTSFGIDADLTLAGLTSIGIVKLNVSLAEKFNVAMKIADIKDNSTIRLLEKYISNNTEVVKYDILDKYPLTKTQEGIFVECTGNPKTTVYNIPLLFKLNNNIDINKLVESFKKVINNHPYLKTIISMDESGNVLFNRNDNSEVNINIIETDKLKELSNIVEPFTLLGGPLYRIVIYKTKESNYLFTDFHHIISDGTSLMILFDDVNKCYDGLEIEKEKYSGYELALEETKIINSVAYNKAIDYWKNILSDIEECIPKKEKDNESGCGNVVINSNVNASLVSDFVNSNNVTMNSLFNSVFSFVLSRFVGVDDVNFTTIHNGRSSSLFSKTISMMVKTIPVVTNINGDTKVVDFVTNMKDYLMNAMMNDAVSFIDLANLFKVKADILFAYQGDKMDIDTLCGNVANRISIPFNESKTPLSFNVYLKDNKFIYNIEFDKDYYNSSFASALGDAFDACLESFINVKYINEVVMYSIESKNAYNELNNTKVDIKPLTSVELFEEQVLLNLDKTAVISNNVSLTFKELNEKVNILANYLIDNGVVQDDIIGIILDRSVNTLITELGVLKSGGAFMNALTSYPDDRVDYCFKDANCKYVISDKAFYNERISLFKDKPYKVILIEDVLSNGNINNPNVKINFNSLAYCIYTSGSTGKPKGVMIEHINLTNMVQTFRGDYRFDEADSDYPAIACCSSSFDASIMDTFLPICNGRTLVISNDEEYHNPLMFKKLVLDNNVKYMVTTPAFLTSLITIDEVKDIFKNMKSIIAGAEVFPKTLYEGLRELNSDLYIINGYGPSECTVACTEKLLNSGDDITIGKPTGNVKVYVMDKYCHVLPKYAIGELIITCDGVGRGYVNLEEKTKLSFFTYNGVRAYHSGDIVRLNKDLELDFNGRRDNQVKLRGFRVELDEIEKVMAAFPNIRQTKVIVKNNGNEDYLVGFFTANNSIDLDELTRHMKQSLTYYMVPSVLMQLDSMPMTQNGKIDKKALPEVVNTPKRNRGKRDARKSLEEKICEMFKKVLSLEDIYVDDNFFELGGTSLSASKITMMLMSEGIEVKYGDIFDNPTPYELTKFIEDRNKEKEEVNNKVNNKSNTREALKYNERKYSNQVKREPLGNVLLTGAVGFLGIHILRELINSEDGHIYCLIRKGVHDSSLIRLKTMLFYYFSDSFEEAINNRITIIEADITDDNLDSVLSKYPINTIINCAACVKHFSDSDILDRINVHGVENLIDISMKNNYKLIQISTTSVPGVHTKESYEKQIKMHENELFVIDDMDNKYGISKYQAELRMFDAIEKGLRGKVIRVGNLMGRHTDGEFQVNYESNMFLSGIRGFATLGMYPISHMTDPMKFSPIDCTAKAVVLLSSTNDMFTAFNCDNRYGFDEMKIIDAVNKNGIKIIPMEDEEYYKIFNQKLGDDKINSKLNGLAAYDIKDAHAVDTDNLFTTNILYRIGFSWPLVDDEYLEKAIYSMLTLDYFDLDNDEE